MDNLDNILKKSKIKQPVVVIGATIKNIISASRRTDIPAFYGDWFLERVKSGFASYLNPFNNSKQSVSLKSDDVACFIFWSKNYLPFMETLKKIEARGYRSYFHYTITGLPDIFESNLISTEKAIKNLKALSDLYSPKHVNWRYDPIIFSEFTDLDFHLQNFDSLAASLQGYVERCYFSYVDHSYTKVKRSFARFKKEHALLIEDPEVDFKVKFANQLANIAESYGISMHTCCGDFLIGTKIDKAHCIDGKMVEKLFYPNGFEFSQHGTRKECGCIKSIDIGTYNSCPHGCIYCYANLNREKARSIYAAHDSLSAVLGYSRADFKQE